MDFDPKVFARIIFVFVLLAVIALALWLKNRFRKGSINYTRIDMIDAMRQKTPYTGMNVSIDIIYQIVCSSTRTTQQFFVLATGQPYFKVAVLTGYWNGYGKPPIAFKGWTREIQPNQLIGPENLLPHRPRSEDSLPEAN